jgi:sec-independent protein translocase protein TatC
VIRPPRPRDALDDSEDEVEQHRMPLLEHLQELRARVIRALIAIAIGLMGGMFVAKDTIDFLMAPIKLVLPGDGSLNRMDHLYRAATGWLSSIPGWDLIVGRQARGDLTVIGSLEGVWTWFEASLVVGGLLALPVVTYQLWAFVAPGLYKTERRVVLPLALASSGLFVFGALFAYILIIPMAFGFFLTFLDVENSLSIEDAVQTVVRIMLAFGACYQLPVVVWFLARIGLIDHRDMVRFFRYAIVGIFVIAALVTPPDVLTQILLGIPLTLLYIASIGVAWLFTTKVRSEETF